MRVLAVAGVFLMLAGCAAPADDEEPDPLFGLCPQWLHGPGGQTAGLHLGNGTEATRQVELGPAAAEYEGFPLDLYRITLTTLSVDGRLELRAFDADGRQLAIRDYRQESPQLNPVVVFTDGKAVDHEFEVFLAPISHDGEAAPAPVTLRWTLDGADADVAFDVTYHYRVCGADV